RFDRSGLYVFFMASTNVGQSAGWLDMNAVGHPASASIYALVLKKTTPSPMAPESDEEGAGAGSGSAAKPGRKQGDKPHEKPGVAIDFEDLDQRIVALPSDRANYQLLEVGAPGVLFVGAAPIAFDDEAGGEIQDNSQVPVEITRFDLKTRKAEKF